jgi:hypothetical protein
MGPRFGIGNRHCLNPRHQTGYFGNVTPIMATHDAPAWRRWASHNLKEFFMSTHINGAAAHGNWHFSAPAATGNPSQRPETHLQQPWYRPRPPRPDNQHTQPGWNPPHRPQPDQPYTRPGWNPPHQPQPDYQYTRPGWNPPYQPQPDHQYTRPGWNPPPPPQPDYQYTRPGWNPPYRPQPDRDYSQPDWDYRQTSSRPTPRQPDHDDGYRTPYAGRRPVQPHHRLSNR